MEVKENLIYLYCITNKAPELKDVEGWNNKPRFVYHKGIYAVISRVRENEFSEDNLKKNLSDLEWIKAKASKHEKVIEEVMKDTCVLPFKFGTIFNTEDNLKVMLEEHAEELKMNLEDLDGKEEWGVKIYCDVEKLKVSLTQKDEELLKIDREIDSSSTGKVYFLKKKKEELIKELINKKINEHSKDSFLLLKSLSLSCKINKLLPKDITEREDDMILNCGEKARA